MPKCPRCGKDDFRIIIKKNSTTIFECEAGHLFERKEGGEKDE